LVVFAAMPVVSQAEESRLYAPDSPRTESYFHQGESAPIVYESLAPTGQRVFGLRKFTPPGDDLYDEPLPHSRYGGTSGFTPPYPFYPYGYGPGYYWGPYYPYRGFYYYGAY